MCKIWLKLDEKREKIYAPHMIDIYFEKLLAKILFFLDNKLKYDG